MTLTGEVPLSASGDAETGRPVMLPNPIDNGCKYSKACLSCHLPECVEDVPMFAQIRAKEARNNAERADAVLVAQETMSRAESVKQVAKDFSVTERTIQRILARTEG